MRILLILLIFFFNYTTYSQTAEEYFKRGLEKVIDGEFEEALSEFNKGIKLNPNNSQAYNDRALINESLKNYYNAISDYSKSIEINPNSSITYTNRGIMKNKLKMYATAIQDFDRAIVINSKSSAAFLNRGVSKYFLKDKEAANYDYSKVIELNNDSDNTRKAYVNRARLHQDSFAETKEEQDLESACIDMKMAAILGDLNSEKWVKKYQSLCNNTKVEQKYLKILFEQFQNEETIEGAISILNKAIELDPNLADAYYYRGRLKYDYERKKINEKPEEIDFSDAIYDFTKAIELDPNIGNAYYYRANAKGELGDMDGGCSDWRKAANLEGDRNEAAKKRIEKYCNNTKTAEEYFERGLEKENGDYEGAIADFNKAIELDPNYAKAYFNRGLSKSALKDYNGAISDFNKFIELLPDYAEAYYSRGVVKNFLKDLYGAIADFTKAIELDPDDALAYSIRGVSKENLGDLDGACSDWKKAASLGDENSMEWIANQCN